MIFHQIFKCPKLILWKAKSKKFIKRTPPQVAISYPVLNQFSIFTYIWSSYAWCNPTKCEYLFFPPTDLVENFRECLSCYQSQPGVGPENGSFRRQDDPLNKGCWYPADSTKSVVSCTRQIGNSFIRWQTRGRPTGSRPLQASCYQQTTTGLLPDLRVGPTGGFVTGLSVCRQQLAV